MLNQTEKLTLIGKIKKDPIIYHYYLRCIILYRKNSALETSGGIRNKIFDDYIDIVSELALRYLDIPKYKFLDLLTSEIILQITEENAADIMKSLIKYSGSTRKAAQLLDLSHTLLSLYSNGKRKIPLDRLSLLAERLGIKWVIVEKKPDEKKRDRGLHNKRGHRKHA